MKDPCILCLAQDFAAHVLHNFPIASDAGPHPYDVNETKVT